MQQAQRTEVTMLMSAAAQKEELKFGTVYFKLFYDVLNSTQYITAPGVQKAKPSHARTGRQNRSTSAPLWSRTTR